MDSALAGSFSPPSFHVLSVFCVLSFRDTYVVTAHPEALFFTAVPDSISHQSIKALISFSQVKQVAREFIGHHPLTQTDTAIEAYSRP